MGDFFGSKGKEIKVNNLEELVEKVMVSPLDYFDFTKKNFVSSVLQAKLNISEHNANSLRQLLMFRLNKGELSVAV